MKTSKLVRIVAAIVVLAVLAVLFIRTLDDTRSTPYTIEATSLAGWRLALHEGGTPTSPVLLLRPPEDVVPALFRQVFSRAMESLTTPVDLGIPVVLRAEFDRSLRDQFTPAALLEAARSAQLETAALVPACMVHRRVSVPGATRQVFFAVFDAPAIDGFRRQLGLTGEPWAPILFVAGAGADFLSWLPLGVDRERECMAPIEAVEG